MGRKKLKILDVGGAKNTYQNATHIIDILPKPENCIQHYTQMDICKGKWPFEDKEFDYIYCSNVLEDIKDPALVCNELIRVGKAGRIVFPSVMTECTKGVDTWHHSDKYAGFCHHRWLCFLVKDGIMFVPKWPITHIFDWTRFIPSDVKKKNFFVIYDWKDNFRVFESVRNEWDNIYNILKDYFKKDPLNEQW